MKNIFKAILIITILAGITSCNLDLAPENVMVDEITFKDAKTTEAALIGAYTRLNAAFAGAPTGVNNYANTGYALLFGEVGTSTIQQRDNSSFINMESAQYNANDHSGYILSIWNTAYNAIDYANNIIVNIPKFGEFDQTLMQKYIAEAKFIRAYEYFILLSIYGDGALTGDMNGLGLIIRLKPYEGYRPEEIETRATVGETYNQIITDINEALPYLSNDNATTLQARTRATKTAAYALLSRIYLYKGTYTNNQQELKLSSDFADSVINNSTKGYVFSSSYSHHTTWMFPLNTTSTETNSANYSDEDILISPSYSSTAKYGNGVGSLFFNKTNFFCDPLFIQKYETGDRRGYIDPTTGVVSLIWIGSETSYYNDKTSYKFNNGNGYNNVIMLRVSEAKLTKAEVSARLNGVNTESVKQLNDIYLKPFQTKPTAYTVNDFTSSAQLINRILLERERELAYEGLNRYDYIRTGRALRNATLNNNQKILPIPNYEVQISYGKIIQNSGFRN